MVQVTVPAAAAAALAAAREAIEVRDESGKRLGYFLPPVLHQRLLHEWAQRHVTPAEVAAARTEPGGCSLAEVWARLGRG